jgi:hypothetical protein
VTEEAKGHNTKVSTSYATTERSRHKVVEPAAESIRQQRIPHKMVTLHWEFKIISSRRDKYKTGDRLVVVVANSDRVQLLGASHYDELGCDEACGHFMADHTVNQLL